VELNNDKLAEVVEGTKVKILW